MPKLILQDPDVLNDQQFWSVKTEPWTLLGDSAKQKNVHFVKDEIGVGP